VTDRSGNYPAPPYWPDRLTHHDPAFRVSSDVLLHLVETDRIAQSYITDGYPGPCVMIFDDGKFADWHPALTIDRAEHFADERA
jgi:hypothetical protein